MQTFFIVLSAVQIVGMIWYSWKQGCQMRTSTEGLISTYFFLNTLYVVVMLILLHRSLQELLQIVKYEPNEKHVKGIFNLYVILPIFWLGLVIYILFSLLIIFDDSRKQFWSVNDLYTIATVIGMLTISLYFLRNTIRRKGWLDPYVKAAIASCAKGVPQVFMALEMLHGADGIPWSAILIYHGLFIPRTIQISYLFYKNTKDKNAKGALIAESINWITWIFVTVAK